MEGHTDIKALGELEGEAMAVVGSLRQAVALGQKHWFPALLEVIAAWRLPQEEIGGRRYCYLIGGEAFDWLLLAERLSLGLDGLIPEAEQEALLFEGRPPLLISDDEFRRLIGGAKYRAHLNFVYGVIVEGALQLAVEEEVAKEGMSHAWISWQGVQVETYQRLYGACQVQLLQTFLQERGLPSGDAISLDKYKEFVYWLFKYRLRSSDPARVASDTRKGMARLARLQARARPLQPHD
jgi:hypothetical protein